MFKEKSAQRGASMIEVLGVLSVVGMISVGLMSGINAMYSQVKVSLTRTQISRIVKNARNVLTVIDDVSSDSYDTIDDVNFFKTEQLVKLEIVDDSGVSGDTIASPYGGAIKVGYYVETTSQEKRLVITFQDMPKKPCTDVLKIDWGDDSSSGLTKIVVQDGYAGTTLAEYVWKYQLYNTDGSEKALSEKQHYLPVEYDTMFSACTSTTSKGADIRWEYSL